MAQTHEVLRFAQIQSVVDVTFLAELSEHKLNVLKLSEDPVDIVGYFSPNRYDSVPARLQLDVSSLRPSATSRLDCHAAPGQLLLFNTIEGFRGCDKQELMRRAAERVWSDITSGAAEAEPWRLCRFLLIMHGDLKHYKFHYWFAFPALKPPAPFSLEAPPASLATALPAPAVDLIAAACAAWRYPPASEAGAGADAPGPSSSSSGHPSGSVPEVLARSPSPFWLLTSTEANFSREVAAHPLSDWARLGLGAGARAGGGGGGGDGGRHLMLVFSDGSHQGSHPAWQLRNALLMAAVRWRVGGGGRLRVLCLRESSRGGGRLDPQRSQLLAVRLPDITIAPDTDADAADAASGSGSGSGGSSWPPRVPGGAAAAAVGGGSSPGPGSGAGRCPEAVGWEANAQGRLLPRFMDLGPHLRPEAQAEQAVDLNLRLMRWRAVPELEVGALAATKCLLLGAGTLGCAVGRTLQAWGVRHITLVDSGRVAFSNPVRQSLYTFEDCLAGGRPKAEAAAEALRRIFPSALTRGLQLSIPMPGHPPGGPADEEALQQATQQLDTLVSEHDAVFLLTDTRESRWLPALLAAVHGKIAITAAVGFDSFLVMRHGAPPGAANEPAPPAAAPPAAQAPPAAPCGRQPRRLGCYFCNDVFAPANSTRDRSLDQQCTVARPGLAPVAGAMAVELMAAMVQHGAGQAAVCAPPPSVAAQQRGDPPPLGPAPHMVRGQLCSFSQVLMEGWAFGQCTACSAAVVGAYRARGWGLVREALGSPAALEALTGLSELHAAAAAAMMEDEEEAGEEGQGTEGKGVEGGEGDGGEVAGRGKEGEGKEEGEDDWTEL